MNFNRLKIRFKYNKLFHKLYNILKYIFFGIYNTMLFIIGKIMSIIPIENNKIVVVNYNGKGFGDNPKYIIQELLKDKEGKYKIVWLVNDIESNKKQFPASIKLVKNETLNALKELSTAKIWIDNTRKRFYPPKRKNQIYIQTWHAGVGIKKVGKDAQNTDKASIKIALKDSKMTDLLVSNSKYRTDIYRNSFQYLGKILEVGIPRNDILLNIPEEIIEKTKKKLGIPKEQKIVLYAPTFRKSDSMDLYNLNSNELLDALNKKFGDEWVVLLRLHPYISDFSNEIESSQNVIDVTKFDDLSELLLIADVVISDYSSLIFDYSINKKPVFLYAKDYEEYYEKEGLNFSREELPFDMALDFESLLKNILTFNYDDYMTKLNRFFEKVGLNETGKASIEIKKYIDKEIGV